MAVAAVALHAAAMHSQRIALVGTGSRAGMYLNALLGPYRHRQTLVALCDTNAHRLAATNRRLVEPQRGHALPTYLAADFDGMVREQRVDTVIVTTVDALHHVYIIHALELGCDVITEKPMTIDAASCQAILDAVKRTGRRVQVTFNYRYTPRATLVRQLITAGAIGTPLSAHFEWLLDTRHGADYFRRWHREKQHSGGLLVHKATHHFDLVNWWLSARPELVYALGGLRFYGQANGTARGEARPYDRATGSAAAADDPYALHLDRDPVLKELYLDAEQEDGYQRDRNVFGEGITIEDDLAVLVRYDTGATLSYHLTAYSPWEGFRIAINGTRGRLELELVENPWCPGAEDADQTRLLAHSTVVETAPRERLLVRPLWGPPREMAIPPGDGDHGGGDARLLEDLFGAPAADPFGRAASHEDGAWSILTGIAANQALATAMPVRTRDLCRVGRGTSDQGQRPATAHGRV